MSIDLDPDDEHILTTIKLLCWPLGIPVPKLEPSLSCYSLLFCKRLGYTLFMYKTS